MTEAEAQHDDDRLVTPRNLIAFIILALFCVQTLLPYWVGVPDGRAGDMIANGAKVVETVLVLVLGGYFTDSVNSWRKDRALAKSVQANATLAATAQTAGEALAASTPAAVNSGAVSLEPGESVRVKAETPAPPTLPDKPGWEV